MRPLSSMTTSYYKLDQSSTNMKTKTGKPQLENGYVRIATELFDQFQSLYLSPNEWKILMCVIRKTYGWRKKEDKISLSQFQKSTKISRPNVHRAIKTLVAKQILVAKQSTAATVYSVNTVYSEWSNIGGSRGSGVVAKQIRGGSQTDKRVVAKQSTKLVAKQSTTKDNKDTITKDTIQKIVKPFSKITDINDEIMEEISIKYQAPISFVRSKLDDMELWAGQQPPSKIKNRNWKLTLMQWVKRDALQITQQHHDSQRRNNKYGLTHTKDSAGFAGK